MKVMLNKLDKSAEISVKDNLFTLHATHSEFDEFGNICYKTGVSVDIPKGYIGVLYSSNNVETKDLAFVNGAKILTHEDKEEIVLKFKPTACFADNEEKDEKAFKETSDFIAVPQLQHTDIVHNGFKIGDAIGVLVIMDRPSNFSYSI